MDTVPGLRALQAHKQQLLLESELNRQVLRIECGKLAFRAGQFRRNFEWIHSAWIWAAPLAGFLLARRRRKAHSLFAKGSIWFTALRAGWRAWTAMRSARPGAKPEP